MIKIRMQSKSDGFFNGLHESINQYAQLYHLKTFLALQCQRGKTERIGICVFRVKVA